MPESTAWNGGEGTVWDRGHVYFATKGDNRVWDYHPKSGRIALLYDLALDPMPVLRGVDNIGVARNGDLIVAEDGGNMELALISFDLVVSPLLQVVGEPTSEIAGPFLRKRRRRRKSRRGRNDLHIP